MALHEGTEFINGQIRDTNLNSNTPLRMADVPELGIPELAIEFLPSTETAVDLSYPATTVVGPAIGNAIFASVGVRLRHIQIRPADVLAMVPGDPHGLSIGMVNVGETKLGRDLTPSRDRRTSA
ncbi:MAG: hypothetical protein NWQ45_08690 [Congregibacter sp.]|nr:hypothetical protein [Congregibacter sp.]